MAAPRLATRYVLQHFVRSGAVGGHRTRSVHVIDCTLAAIAAATELAGALRPPSMTGRSCLDCNHVAVRRVASDWLCGAFARRWTRNDGHVAATRAVLGSARGDADRRGRRRRALQHERFAPAAAAVLSELALTLGCERASIGFHSQGRLRMAATSGGSEPLQQPALVRAVAVAMHEALDQRAAVVYPLPAGALPMPCFAHAELMRLNGGLAVCSVPILGAERVTGVLLLERRDGFEAATLETAKDVALFVGPLLEMKHRLEAPVGGRLIEAMAPRGVRHGSDVRPSWRWGVAAALSALCAAVSLWPVTFDIVAPARALSAYQKAGFAPVRREERTRILTRPRDISRIPE